MPIYNALDPQTHFRVAVDPALKCDLAFIGHRLPDRESRVEEFFFRSATLAPEMSFVLGGEGWGDKKLPANVRWIGHVPSERHNVVNCSARMVLNVNRDSMAKVGFSPPTRVFEAAGAGACLITDMWEGVEHFFEPDTEILIAKSAGDLAQYLRQYDSDQGARIGRAMQRRALRDHSYASRAAEVDEIFRNLLLNVQSTPAPDLHFGATQTTSSSARRAV
ncbi:MAG TPA: glycosyltransferase [Candidatus Sulfotelmatobacter sp.]|nr:glycosyltransferase [Candidatus Sulfotelmatobacter sp.]